MRQLPCSSPLSLFARNSDTMKKQTSLKDAQPQLRCTSSVCASHPHPISIFTSFEGKIEHLPPCLAMQEEAVHVGPRLVRTSGFCGSNAIVVDLEWPCEGGQGRKLIRFLLRREDHAFTLEVFLVERARVHLEHGEFGQHGYCRTDSQTFL